MRKRVLKDRQVNFSRCYLKRKIWLACAWLYMYYVTADIGIFLNIVVASIMRIIWKMLDAFKV